MRRVFLTILLLLFFSFAESQIRFFNVDSLKLLIANAKTDTAKVRLYAIAGFTYAFLQVDTGIKYAQRAISLARQIQYKKGEAQGLSSYGWALWAAGDYDKAVEVSLKSLNLYKDLKDFEWITFLYAQLEVFYRDVEDFGQAFKYGILAKNLYDSMPGEHVQMGSLPLIQIGALYYFTNHLDSASFYITKGYENEKAHKQEFGYVYNLLGNVEAKKKNYPKALGYYYSAISTAIVQKNYFDIVNTYTFLARLYQEIRKMDSSIWYAKEVLANPRLSIFRRGALDALAILAQNYRLANKNDSALKYLELRVALNDSLFNKEKSRAIQNLTFSEELQQQEIERAKIQYQNQVRLYALYGLAGVFLLIGIILYRNNKVKQKANVLLKQQKEKVESTLKALESTQAQLIQSEKMASLGELTAGIAHEIQNPLNFVNNFSEVNTELVEELKTEALKGNKEQVISIADDIKANAEKINHHGKRADAIVKGMLLHSQSSKGKKEPTDINTLADEYLRLSYHGLRAKDKSFNAGLQTGFDPSVGNINIVPQDIGRVLLNLYNNAFYEVNEKKKQQAREFEPTVSVVTRRTGDKLSISVKDNGNGIPQKILDKIFQPFFTSKPTGEGTGLGLSLSYDIVKAHGGEIKVTSHEGEGAEFQVLIPYV